MATARLQAVIFSPAQSSSAGALPTILKIQTQNTYTKCFCINYFKTQSKIILHEENWTSKKGSWEYTFESTVPVKLKKGFNNIQLEWKRGRKTLQKAILDVDDEANKDIEEANQGINKANLGIDKAVRNIKEASLANMEARDVKAETNQFIDEASLKIEEYIEENVLRNNRIDKCSQVIEEAAQLLEEIKHNTELASMRFFEENCEAIDEAENYILLDSKDIDINNDAIVQISLIIEGNKRVIEETNRVTEENNQVIDENERFIEEYERVIEEKERIVYEANQFLREAH